MALRNGAQFKVCTRTRTRYIQTVLPEKRKAAGLQN